MIRPARLSLLVLSAVGASVLATASPALAAGPSVTYSGAAYGSSIRLGTLVRSGQTSQVSACTESDNFTKSNNTAAVSVPGLGTVGAVVTRLRTTSTPTPESFAYSKTGATDLFGGKVHAQSITAYANVTRNGTTYSTGGRSTFVGLTINGNRINASPAPNTTIGLPGVGRIVLNQQTTSAAYALPSINVTAVVVFVLPNNNQGLPAGVILLSSATAGLHKPTYDREGGHAFGTSAQVGSVLKSGQTALVAIPCGGSNGEIVSNSVASSTIPGVLVTGAVATTAQSSDSATASTARLHAKVSHINLLGGRVRADAVTTHAYALRQNGTTTFRGSGSTFVKLVIGGQVITGTPPPNTSYSVAGVGTVYVNVIHTSAHTVDTEAVQIVLSSAQGSLPAGAVINIAVAEATILD